jgi:hypothetical protein
MSLDTTPVSAGAGPLRQGQNSTFRWHVTLVSPTARRVAAGPARFSSRLLPGSQTVTE